MVFLSFFRLVRRGASIPRLGRVVTVRRSLWHEPRPVDAPPVGRLDWLLAGVVAAAALVEGIVRPGSAWQPLVTVLALAVVPALLWRRGRPLVAVLVGWGVAGVLSVAQLAAHAGDLGLYSTMAVLVLLYSLVRWGSGREVVLGTAFVAVVVVLGMYASSGGWADVFGGSVLLLLLVALGAVFRYRADLWHRQQREIRNQERVALARELHDTVAHHVSAIAVQAQAGGVVAGSRPEKAVEVLAAIESEASRTLAEMRSMVRVLREEGAVACSPQPGVADLPALARADATPAVEVSLDGSLTRLARPVDTALYRLAQESLTNAVRHARSATRVGIDVRREGDAVRLRVSDDGRTEPGPAPRLGFGLLGMAERAQLLGGSLSAGPGPGGGWVVEAVLPVEAWG
ncbi:MAG: sensor histidine kinase [Saccharothrix sp.]|nr:sensor histidine kinase [Saccharothrix sp.]